MEVERGTKLFVANLSSKAKERDLEDLLKAYGKIKDVRIVESKVNYAFVEFEDPKDVKAAVEGLDYTELFDRKIRLEVADGKRGGRVGKRLPPREKRSHSRDSYYLKRSDDKKRSYSKSRSYSRGRRGRDHSRKHSHSRSHSRNRSHNRGRSHSKDRHRHHHHHHKKHHHHHHHDHHDHHHKKHDDKKHRTKSRSRSASKRRRSKDR